MKLKRKLLAMVLALALALAGCGGSASASKKEDSTVQWFNNTYAILTTVNGQNVHLVGGMNPGTRAKVSAAAALESSWDVTDKESAEETMEWLLEEGGHRAQFQEEMEILKEDGVLDLTLEEARKVLVEEYALDEETAACYVHSIEAYQARGEGAIDAWDECRAMSLLGWYYLAEYYTLEESLDKSLEIATQMQQKYGSWDEMVESYLDGYVYWSEEDPEDPESSFVQRRAVYEKLKEEKNSCFNLAWDTPLSNAGWVK